jgi:hypothetical protein
MREIINAHKILARNPGGKIIFGRPRLRRKDNIKLDLKGIWSQDVDRMHLAPDRV